VAVGGSWQARQAARKPPMAEARAGRWRSARARQAPSRQPEPPERPGQEPAKPAVPVRMSSASAGPPLEPAPLLRSSAQETSIHSLKATLTQQTAARRSICDPSLFLWGPRRSNAQFVADTYLSSIRSSSAFLT